MHLVSTMERKGIPLQCAYGTDFSEKLIEAANQEAKTYLSPKQNEKISVLRGAQRKPCGRSGEEDRRSQECSSWIVPPHLGG